MPAAFRDCWLGRLDGGSESCFFAIVQDLDLVMISNLNQVSPPQDMSFPNGYEVVEEPKADAKPIKVLPARLGDFVDLLVD